MLGQSTFGLSMWLLKWLPVRLVDRFLLIVSRLMLGDTARFGLDRPELGPIELKNLSGKTPVLDVGTLAKIKSGDIKVLSQLYHVSYNEYITSSLFILLSLASYVCLKGFYCAKQSYRLLFLISYLVSRNSNSLFLFF
jgi:hypothetical protein